MWWRYFRSFRSAALFTPLSDQIRFVGCHGNNVGTEASDVGCASKINMEEDEAVKE